MIRLQYEYDKDYITAKTFWDMCSVYGTLHHHLETDVALYFAVFLKGSAAHIHWLSHLFSELSLPCFVYMLYTLVAHGLVKSSRRS